LNCGADTVSGSVECTGNEMLFLSIPLTPGKHHIQLSYSTPWLRAGILTSWMTLLGIIMYQVIRIKRRPKSAERETQKRL